MKGLFDAQSSSRLVETELGKMGWTEEGLEWRAKADRRKVRMARRLRAEEGDGAEMDRPTAEDGTWTHAGNRLY